MVKYVISFLISFKKFSENDVNVVTEATLSKDVKKDEKQYFCYFKPNEDRKNICNITCIFPGAGSLIESKLSITCWSRMVKIYSKKSDVALRTASYDGKIWAAFSIYQNLQDFDKEQLKAIYPLTLEVRFNEDSKSILQRERSEKVGTYWCIKTQEKREMDEWFKPLYLVQNKQILSSNHQLKKSSHQSASVKSKNIPSNRTSVKSIKSAQIKRSKTVFSDLELYRKVAKRHLTIVNKAVHGVLTGDNISRPVTSSSGCSLILPVSYLFSDKEVWVLKNDKPLSSNIEDTYVFFTAYSFLNTQMRMLFNPFTIHLQALQNLPTQELENEGIKKICAEYELLPIIPTTRTKYQDLNNKNNLYFKDFQMFPTDEFSPISVFSTIQSKKLLVRVLGIKDVPKPFAKPVNSVSYGFYGSDLYDNRLSTCFKVKVQNRNLIISKSKSSISLTAGKNNKATLRTTGIKAKSKMKSPRRSFKSDDIYLRESNILLGTARIDLSPLVFGNSCIFAYEEISSLPIIISIPKKSEKEKTYFDRFNITDAHTDESKFEQGILKNRSLFQSNTMVKLTAKCGFLLMPQVLKDSPFLQDSYSRTIAIFVDKQFAAHTLKQILKSNSETLKMENYNLPLVPLRNIYEVKAPSLLRSYLLYEQQIYSTETYEFILGENHSSSLGHLESWFTGFCIDCINMVLMYIEGPTINVFPSLLTELVKVNSNQGRIMYSSDLMYDSRVYGAFKELGGIYCIVMKNTVADLIKKEILCHRTAIPEPALKALKSISRLFKCKNVLEGVQNGYLPRPEQLLSFDIEFGLPLSLER